ncbi:hypothetical protein GGH99_000610 [Coemansia sp. RSA 1285]|nr:hypothetical protein GGH99_000610 [Coemansia sp. RSA 1285]
MSTPFASVNATQAVPAPMPFLSADTMTTGLPLQAQTQNSNAGGFANVSANNPFRQSMYPTQSDALSQQAMIVGQMAQLGIQSPPQQQQHQHQQMHNMQQTHGAANQNFQTASAVGGNGNFANFDMFK